MSISYFIFLSYYITSSISPILVNIATDFNISITKASWLITFNVLFLGIGNLFWIPLSLKIGKRPVILFSTAIFFASSIWSSLAQGYGSLLGARIVQGFGASSCEALGPAVVADLYFVHERGLWVGVCMFMIACGAAVGGIFGGLVANANSDWRWVFWMNTVLTGFSFVIAFLFQAETNFQRPAENESGEGLHPSELEAIRARVNNSWAQSLGVMEWYDRYGYNAKLYLAYYPLLTKSRETSIWWLWWRPWLMLRYPAVIWASLLIGLNLGGFVLIQTANSGVFPAEYNFSALGVGNIAIGVSDTEALFYSTSAYVRRTVSNISYLRVPCRWSPQRLDCCRLHQTSRWLFSSRISPVVPYPCWRLYAARSHDVGRRA